MLSWLAILNNEIVDFSLIDVLFGKFNIDEDFIVINHILLLAKFYIYRSKLDNTKPSLEVFKTKLKAIFNIEFLIAKRNINTLCHLIEDELLLQRHRPRTSRF